jgi:hypothetical protein
LFTFEIYNITPIAKQNTIPMILPILKNDPNKGLKLAGESYFVITGASIGYIPHVTPSKKRPIIMV